MAARKGKIYWNIVRASIKTGMSKAKIKELTYKKAFRHFVIKRTAYIRMFLDHPVTKEIQRGPFANNTSGCLTGIYSGNLYSFIGFSDGGDAVIESVVSAIRTQSWIRKTPTSINFYKRGKQLIYRVKHKMVFPGRDELARVAPMPQNTEPGSWLVRVEAGFSGLQHYIYRRKGIKASVSGSAVMSTGRYQKKATGFKRTTYVSGILRLLFGRSR